MPPKTLKKRIGKKGEEKKEVEPKKKTKIKKPKIVGSLKVPKNVYKKVIDEIKTPTTKYAYEKQLYEPHLHVSTQQHCHASIDKYETTQTEGILNHQNFLIAAKSALERRDFKNLYKIIAKGHEINNDRLNILLFEYLYMAIKIDPAIVNREEMLKEAVQNCKVIYTIERSRTFGPTVFNFPNEEDILRHISFDHKIVKAIQPRQGYRDTLKIEANNIINESEPEEIVE